MKSLFSFNKEKFNFNQKKTYFEKKIKPIETQNIVKTDKVIILQKLRCCIIQ